MSEKLSGSLQENLLVLLCYSDTAYNLIRDSVPANLFMTDVYRDIVTRVYDYIDQFSKPPKDHLPDLVEKELEGKKGELYEQVLDAIARVRPTLNEEYILKQLEKFIRLQNLKIGVIRASELIGQDKIDEAEVFLEKSLKQRLSLFSPGMTLEQGIRVLASPEGIRDPINLGIPTFDRLGLGPARKELHLLLGMKKAGKTWWLIHLAKRALLRNWKVAHISLEVGEKLMMARVLQGLYALRYSSAQTAVATYFDKDSLGRITSFNREKLRREALDTPEGLKYARDRLTKFIYKNNLYVKEFPAGSITAHGVEAYLDSLERMHKFAPDLLVVDYPQLMKIDPKYYRLELGAITRDLRGIAVDRNIAVAVVSQGNRTGANSRILTGESIGEDFSQLQTCDVALTYTQSSAEYQLGLARLYVEASRISRQQMSVMISQAYDIGQFCLDSAPMQDSYLQTIKDLSGKDPFQSEE